MLRTRQIHSTLAVAFAVAIAAAWPTSLGAQQSSGDRLKELEKRINTTVREMASVDSLTAADVRSDVDAAIVELVPEGSKVKKGDVIAKLDGSVFEELLVQQRLASSQTEAGMKALSQKQQRLKDEYDARKKLAALSLSAAEKQREQTLGENGELALQLKETAAELNVARAKLQAASDILAAAKVERISRPEVAGAIAATAEAKEAIQLAEARKSYLEGPYRELREAQTQLGIEQTRFESLVVNAEYQQRLMDVATSLRALEAEVMLAKSRSEQTERKLAGCAILAPSNGVVEYITGGRSREPMAVGTQVRNGQPLLRVVDLEQLVIRARVNETNIAKIQVGQSALVKIDAYPNLEISGKVERISPTPEPTSVFSADVKNYSVIISLDEKPVPLQLGLTALVEIDTGDE